MALVKFRFSKDFPHGESKNADRKGSVRMVTERAAKYLKANGFGDLVEKEVKEDKEAEARETKEEKTVRKTKKRK